MVGNERQGWAIFAAMGVLFLAGVGVCLLGRGRGQSAASTRSASTGGNMEGKEVRFGIAAVGALRRRHDGRLLRRGQRHA